MLVEMSTAIASKSAGTVLKKSINSLKVPKKAINESALELINVNSDDFIEEIDAPLQNNYRFRKFANEAVKTDGAWLIHNRSLEEAFGKARKRLQHGEGLGQSKTISVTTQCGFLFTKNWSVVESIACNGLKTGNLQDTWLGKPQNGVVISQCADIGLAYLADVGSKEAESYHADLASGTDLKADSVTGSTYFVVLVRWLKSKVYVTQVTPPRSHLTTAPDDRLDPQPGYTCHMTKWSRMDPLDPSKLTLTEVFHNSQVYIYEYDEEMDLKTTLEHVLPFAVVKCQWDLLPEKFSLFRSVNDGAILLPRKPKESTAPRKALLSTPPSTMKILAEKRVPKSDPKTWTKEKHIAALFTSSILPTSKEKRNDVLSTKLAVPVANATTSDRQQSMSNAPNAPSVAPSSSSTSSKIPLQNAKFMSYSHHHSDPVAASGRKLQAALDRTYMQSGAANNDDLPHYVINTCYLVWPVSERQDGANEESVKVETWQFPVKIISYRNPISQTYEGLLQPRLIISDLVSFSRLHLELAGVQEPSGPSPELSLSDISEQGSASETNILDPRRLRGRSSLSPCLPFVSIDRLREWIVPSKENVENDASAKPSRFAGYRGTYYLLSLLESSAQQAEVAKLYETLKSKQVACFIKMPCSENAAFCIFPDSDFSKSLSIPPLDSLDSTSFHGILLLPHSIHSSPLERCLCQLNSHSRTGVSYRQPPAPVENKWSFSLSSFVDALPGGGKDLLQAVSDLATSPKGDSQTSPLLTPDSVHVFSHTFTPMSPQEPTSHEDPALIIQTPDVQIPDSPIKVVQSPVPSCDMELETSFESNIPSSPENGRSESVKRSNRHSSHGCGIIPLKVPLVPGKYLPYSLSFDVPITSSQVSERVSKTLTLEHSVRTSTSLLTIKKEVCESKATFSDYNEWRRKKDQERGIQPNQSSSHSKTTLCTEILQDSRRDSIDIDDSASADAVDLQETLVPSSIVEEEGDDDHVRLFSPASPDESQMAPLLSSSRDPSHEEEEGEIVDDEDEEIIDETDTSSDYSRSSDQSPRSKKPRESGHKPIRIPCSPRRRRSKHDSSHHQTPKKSKRRRKYVGDVDYRIARPEDTHFASVRKDPGCPVGFSTAMPHTNRFKDTDYRYQVYIPRSAETVSVPVKVINHAYLAEHETLHSYSRFPPRRDADVRFTQPSPSSVPRNRSKSRTRFSSEKMQTTTSQRLSTTQQPPVHTRLSMSPGIYHPTANGSALLENPTGLIVDTPGSTTHKANSLLGSGSSSIVTGTLPAPYTPLRLRLQTTRPRLPPASSRSESVAAAIVDSNSGSSSGV
ncbi:Protein TASOR [Taenia crassiceps]|uniref:Protein TASOR n=1 Tax=Taenia crassiceps TaxID=6207 RepID=A0ABR4QR06_9CEST